MNTESESPAITALWAGDTGVLGEQSRRALLELLKGPYLAGRESSRPLVGTACG